MEQLFRAGRTGMDEQDLITQSKDGGLDAFNQLVLQYQGLVYNLSFRMLGDQATAQDLTQEVFISAFRHLDSFHGGNFRAWLLRIAANACRDYLRSAHVRHNVSLEAMTNDPASDPVSMLPSKSASPEEYVLRRELAAVLQKGLRTLPKEQRLALVLVDVQGFSYEDAAVALGVPVGTVKSRLSRARSAMRCYLEERRELLPDDLRF
ncbi:MAG: sigma-70 family RNA polymerase sigma factor [Chloroflexi bacterium]|nr:sigma-70 family RNA polymerase sigma factor [Chloroflexota bacterium]